MRTCTHWLVASMFMACGLNGGNAATDARSDDGGDASIKQTQGGHYLVTTATIKDECAQTPATQLMAQVFPLENGRLTLTVGTLFFGGCGDEVNGTATCTSRYDNTSQYIARNVIVTSDTTAMLTWTGPTTFQAMANYKLYCRDANNSSCAAFEASPSGFAKVPCETVIQLSGNKIAIDPYWEL